MGRPRREPAAALRPGARRRQSERERKHRRHPDRAGGVGAEPLGDEAGRAVGV